LQIILGNSLYAIRFPHSVVLFLPTLLLFKKKKKKAQPRRQWLTPVILKTQEAEIRRIAVRSPLVQIVPETLSRKTHHKKGLVECLKVKALSSNPSTGKKKLSHLEKLKKQYNEYHWALHLD
jgi:hypothetical protein